MPRPPPLIVAVILAVIVAVPVMVAALVNGNDIVAVIDAVDDQGSTSFVNMATMRSSKSTPRSYRSFSTRPSISLDLHDVEVRGTFHRRASGDRVVLRLVGPRCTSTPLSDVLWNRLRCPSQLICQVRVALG